MATYLLDTNVLMALGWPTHVHYDTARKWLASLGADLWATCPITESGFVRLSSNPRCVDQATTPQGAIVMLRELIQFGNHRFWNDVVPISAPSPMDSLN